MHRSKRIITHTPTSLILHSTRDVLRQLLAIHLLNKCEDKIEARRNLVHLVSSQSLTQPARSIQLTPLLDQMLPSTIHLAGLFQLTFGPIAVIVPQAFLLVVADRPSNTPALASMPAPVHTESKYFTFGYVARTKSICAVRLSSLTPPPPGTRRTSTSEGGLA
jgi:hypothetical protein